MRLQFEVSDELAEELTALQGDIGASTKKELFNNALTLLQWAVRQVKSGKIITATDESADSYSELNMPVFEVARLKGQQATSPLGSTKKKIAVG